MNDRCPVCYGTTWNIDYDYTDDGEMQVNRCETCGWPPTHPSTVKEYRQRWLTLGETHWSHPGPSTLRHVSLLISLIDDLMADNEAAA